jgi:hypothetical protein
MNNRLPHSNLDILESNHLGWTINGESVSDEMKEFLDSLYSNSLEDNASFLVRIAKLNLKKFYFKMLPMKMKMTIIHIS